MPLYSLFFVWCLWLVDSTCAVPVTSTLIDDVASMQVDLSQNESANLTAFFIPCMAIVVVCMALRVISRRMVNEPLKSDDFALLVGGV
jgi:hypothetical protein